MLTDENKESLTIYVDNAQSAFNSKDWERYKVCLLRAKAEFESLADLGNDDPWFTSRLAAINRELSNFEDLQKQASGQKEADNISRRFRRMKGSRLENVKLASEIGLNKSFIPAPRNTTEFPVEWKVVETGKISKMNQSWTARNFMVMDVLAHLFLIHYGRGHFPKERLFLFNSISQVEDREKEILELKDKKVHSSAFSRFSVGLEALIFRNLTGKTYMTSKQIWELLRDTSKSEFIVSFPVRMMKPVNEKRNTTKEEWVTLNGFSRPFELLWKEGEDPEHSSKWTISFSTIMGEMFCHNLLAKGYTFIDKRAYDLPETAQNFYRFFIATEKKPTTERLLNTIIQKMSLTDGNTGQLIHTTIEGHCLEPLKKAGLILDYKTVLTFDDELKFVIQIKGEKGKE